jgi:uncharacterized RmlC-like cupin family protein
MPIGHVKWLFGGPGARGRGSDAKEAGCAGSDRAKERVKEHVGRVVRPGESYVGKQGLRYTPGVSAGSVGSTSLWLGSVPVPPGARTKAHVHEHHESAFYMLSGDEVELWTGDQQQHRDTVRSP